MTYGLKLWDASGNVTFDSTLAAGGVPIALHTVASGASPVYSWPSLAGRTIKGLTFAGNYASQFTIDYALGYPRISYAAQGGVARTTLVIVL